MNDMDRLFGGEQTDDAQPQQPLDAQPATGRPTIAQTAAAVARRRRESERFAAIHEILLIGGLLLLIGGAYFWYRSYARQQAELERQRHEHAMAEKARAAEAERARIAETAAFIQREREKNAKAQAERIRQQEEKRAALERERARAARFRAVRDILRGASIDYWRNATDAERPGKLDVEATFVCLFPGSGNGCAFYEVKVVPGKPFAAQLIREDGDPEPLEADAFAEMTTKTPYLIARDRGDEGGRTGAKAYLVVASKARRAPREVPVPSNGSVYNPSKAEFGALYDAVRTLGNTRTLFSYRVAFKTKALPEDVVLPKTYVFGDEIGRDQVRAVVQRALAEFATKNRRAAAQLPPLEKILETGTLTTTSVR